MLLRALVAFETLDGVSVSDHLRRRLVGEQVGPESEGVIDMPVRVNRGVDLRLRSLPEERREPEGESPQARVDEYETFVRFESRDSAKEGRKMRALCDLDGAARPEELGVFRPAAGKTLELVARIDAHRWGPLRSLLKCSCSTTEHCSQSTTDVKRRTSVRVLSGGLRPSTRASVLDVRALGELGGDVELVGKAEDPFARLEAVP